MLEQEIGTLQLNKKLFSWGGLVIYCGMLLYLTSSQDTMSFKGYAILSLIYFAVIFWKWLTNHVLLKHLTNYINALKSGAMDDALSLGRGYYSIRRNGLTGYGNVTVYDEAAINNDINAYSLVAQ